MILELNLICFFEYFYYNIRKRKNIITKNRKNIYLKNLN